VKDPRVVGRCDHKLVDILFIGLCTFIANGQDYSDMVTFAEQRLDWLQTIITLPHGVPSDDTFRRVFQAIDPETLKSVLERSGMALLEVMDEKQICLDGKKLKGSSPRSRGTDGLYILNAWVAENRLCIGQKRVDDKSNEITAVPQLLDELDVSGAVVSIDAMGCQKEIAKKIIEGKADYLLALKGNQKMLFEEVEDAFRFEKTETFEEKWQADHGRIEQRRCQVLSAENSLSAELLSSWKKLTTLVRVEARRMGQNGLKTEIRYYISSESEQKPAYFNALVRGHWGIENQLHWHLDVTFREDHSRVRKGYGPENLSILRKVALQHISNMKDKASLKKRRYKASLNNDYLEKVLGI